MEKRFFVYIMTNRKDGVLYVGMTNDIQRRVTENKEGINPGFTKQYNLNRLIFYEEHLESRLAIQREKNIKAWKRQWKVDLIQNENPEWHDLSLDF